MGVQPQCVVAVKHRTLLICEHPPLLLTLRLQSLQHPGVHFAQQIHRVGLGWSARPATRGALGPPDPGTGFLLVWVGWATTPASDGHDNGGHFFIGK